MGGTITLALVFASVSILALIMALIKKQEREFTLHQMETRLSQLAQANHAQAWALYRLTTGAPTSPSPPLATTTAPEEPASFAEHTSIREAFNAGAEFSSDAESEHLLTNLHSIYEVLHSAGVVYMWVNNTMHIVRADPEQK